MHRELKMNANVKTMVGYFYFHWIWIAHSPPHPHHNSQQTIRNEWDGKTRSVLYLGKEKIRRCSVNFYVKLFDLMVVDMVVMPAHFSGAIMYKFRSTYLLMSQIKCKFSQISSITYYYTQHFIVNGWSSSQQSKCVAITA